MSRIGTSFPCGKPAIKEWIKAHIPENGKILDIGAGGGTYFDLLQDLNYTMDAIEVYEPAVNIIINKYRSIFFMDLREFEFVEDYDLVIMGDVLEHLSVEDAQKVLNYILQHTKYLIVGVPFNFYQGPEDDNPLEEHLQPDLDQRVMKERYPQLQLLLYIINYTERIWVADGSPCPTYLAYYYAKGALNNESQN